MVAFPTLRPRPSRLLLLAVLAALLLSLVLAASAGAQAALPTISNLTPAPNSTVARGPVGEVTVAAQITSTSPVTEIQFFLDGNRLDVEAAGRSEFELAPFAMPTLAPGVHTVRVTAGDQAGNTNEVTWSFTVVERPDELPRAGGLPLGLALPALFGLGAAAAAYGLRLRRR